MFLNKKLLNIFKRTKTTSDNDTYTCNYINDLFKTSKRTDNDSTYSCTYMNNNFQPKLKTTTKSLTTDAAGNASLNMTANDYLVISVTQKGTTFNCWTSLYCYGSQYHVHTAALETGNAVSGTGTYEIVYIERSKM